jgi:branched-chain amino acid transport system ATP-binding protein
VSDFLHIEGVTAGYSEAVVLNNLSLTVERGRSLAVLGRNGVGKTTLLETLMGNTTVKRGTLRWLGEDITRLRSYARARRGIGWVPQEREVFPSLTVRENLDVTARPGRWTVEGVYELFPRLRERRGNYGGQLSGGEQQMLAIGRALMTNPQLLLLDEPMEGLAPIIVDELAEAIRRMCERDGLTTLIVEQHPVLALSMSQDVIVLERGTVTYSGSSAALAANDDLLNQLLGVAMRAPA